jgi:hypothetical protein
MVENKPFLLRLDLQKFAEDDPTDPPVEPNNGGEPEKRFSQADVDRILKERLERAERKAEEQRAKELEEIERKKLEEQNEFKSLYEKTQTELEQIRKDAEFAKLEATKTNLLVSAGYTGEQLERVRKYVVGTNDEELTTSLEELKQDIPPKAGGVDPSVNNPQRQQPQPKDLADEGRSIYERLKAAGKIRR